MPYNQNDPYHMISVHNGIVPYPKRTWLTHVSYQGSDPNGMAEGHPFLQDLLNVNSEQRIQAFLRRWTQPIRAHPDYKLYYLGRSASCRMKINLPENGDYKVESNS